MDTMRGYARSLGLHMPRFKQATEREQVDCLICLWHLRRYIPLVKLREHQWNQSGSALPFGHWCRIRDGLKRTRTGFDTLVDMPPALHLQC